jgi:hypothetical protein
MLLLYIYDINGLYTDDDFDIFRQLYCGRLPSSHPLRHLYQRTAPAVTDTRAPAGAVDAYARSLRVQAAELVVQATAATHRKPVVESVDSAGGKDAVRQLRAAGAAAEQLRDSPFSAEAEYLRPVSWAGHEKLRRLHDDPEHPSNVDFYTRVFLTGIDPTSVRRARPTTASLSGGGFSASELVNRMPALPPGVLAAGDVDAITALAMESARAYDAGHYPRPAKRATTARSRDVIAIDTLAGHEHHVRQWRATFTTQALEDNSMRRRLSNVRAYVWFYLGTRGVSPWRFLLNQWERLPQYVRTWEEDMMIDFLCWYASGMASAQSVENMHTDIKEWLKGCLNITVPDMQLLIRSKRLIRLWFSKQDLSTRLRPSLPTHMFMYLVHCATRQRDDVEAELDDRIAASSCLLCITCSRQGHMRIGNIAVGSRFDPTRVPQVFWTLLSMSVLIELQPGYNALALPPKVKTTGSVAREPFPWLYEPVPWNFVHNLKFHFRLLKTAGVEASQWATFPLAALDAAGASMPQSFVYKWMVSNLAVEFPEEVRCYKLGTHCLRIAAQTVSGFLGVSTAVRSRQGTWSAAHTLMEQSDRGSMASLYGRTVREILVEVQRYISTINCQAVEWSGVHFAGHDQPPPQFIQSAAEVDDVLKVRHKYLDWATAVQTAAACEMDTGVDDEDLGDMPRLFEVSTPHAVQDMLEEAGLPVPKRDTMLPAAGGAAVNQTTSRAQRKQDEMAKGSAKLTSIYDPASTANAEAELAWSLDQDGDEVDYDWEQHAGRQMRSTYEDDADAVQCFADINDLDDQGPQAPDSPWENSVLAQLITGHERVTSVPLPDSAEEMRVERGDGCLPLIPSQGARLHALIRPTQSSS